MNIPSIEDTTRYTAPPEPRPEGRWDEPEDYPDYLDQFTDEPEPQPQPQPVTHENN